MKFSETWLREWVDPEQSSVELAESLTMAGLEVDSMEPAAPAFDGIVVGKIVDCQPHPNADKLKLCQVDDNTGQSHTVVCGAPNAVAGLIAPFARLGAMLPGDFKIKKAKLRGVESNGMLCSARELGLGEDHDGLMRLPDDSPVGTDFRRFLDLDDRVIEVDLTPNRADCLGVAGIAQDVAAMTRTPLLEREYSTVKATIDDHVNVELVDAQDCPRYVGRVIRRIEAKAQTPLWMQERLRRCGLRSISPLVDVTNYVLLELGQPLHAFDLNRIEGSIRVRRAQADEQLVLLDETEPKLTDELLICDDSGPVAIAGIMGGFSTAVTEQTTDVFLESAWFRPQTISGRARELGMHTDASHRFERGVDPQLQIRAIERATELLLSICGGEPGPVTETVATEFLPQTVTITLRHNQVERLLGIALGVAEIEVILRGLSIELERTEDGWLATPPSRRMDLNQEIDLIEEIARIYGFNHLPARTPQGRIPTPTIVESELPMERVKSVLVERGFLEAINYSFISPAEAVESADLSIMRTSLLPGLLKTLAYNQKRQHPRLRFFEAGVVFPDDTTESSRVAAAVTGSGQAESWAHPSRSIDFFDLKGDLEALLEITGRRLILNPRRVNDRQLHPGQSADILVDDEKIGWIGTLHPSWLKKMDLSSPVVAFELDLKAVTQRQLPTFDEVSKFPSTRVDLAMIFPIEVSWAQICEIVQENGGNLLTKLVVFDEYRGQGISDGMKSLAFGMILQDQKGTLTDPQTDKVKNQVIDALTNAFGATVRG